MVSYLIHVNFFSCQINADKSVSVHRRLSAKEYKVTELRENIPELKYLISNLLFVRVIRVTRPHAKTRQRHCEVRSVRRSNLKHSEQSPKGVTELLRVSETVQRLEGNAITSILPNLMLSFFV